MKTTSESKEAALKESIDRLNASNNNYEVEIAEIRGKLNTTLESEKDLRIELSNKTKAFEVKIEGLEKDLINLKNESESTIASLKEGIDRL